MATPNSDAVADALFGPGQRPADPLAGGAGDGWMTKRARDMFRIAVLLAGFDRDELLRRIAMSTASNRSDLVNAGSVERVMGEMDAEWVAAHPEAQNRRQAAVDGLRQDH